MKINLTNLVMLLSILTTILLVVFGLEYLGLVLMTKFIPGIVATTGSLLIFTTIFIILELSILLSIYIFMYKKIIYIDEILLKLITFIVRIVLFILLVKVTSLITITSTIPYTVFGCISAIVCISIKDNRKELEWVDTI